MVSTPKVSVHDVDALRAWMLEQGLAEESGMLHGVRSGERVEGLLVGRAVRAVRKTRRELDRIRERAREERSPWDAAEPDEVYEGTRMSADGTFFADVGRVPADAVAFYQPFHSSADGEWGIYLMVDALLDRVEVLHAALSHYALLPFEVLLASTTFDVFHHEFFHHLVESMATTVEVLQAASGQPRPLYLEYLSRYHDASDPHPHDPLEEALANAYAHNAFGFISWTRTGVRSVAARACQTLVREGWRLEGPGYRDAEAYIRGRHVAGASLLLGRMCGDLSRASHVPLDVVARSVMPRGHTAYASKPTIPVYLLGSPAGVTRFEHLVPAPVETWCHFFWPWQTADLDRFIRHRRRAEKAALKDSKTARG